MADYDSRIELAIRNGLARVDASSTEARQSVYAAALRSLDRQQQSKGEQNSERARLIRERLVATIDMIEDSYIAPMLLEDLDTLTMDTPDMSEEPAPQDKLTGPNPSPEMPGNNRRRIGLWSLGLVIVLAAIAALAYAVSPGWLATPTSDLAAYEAAPPVLATFDDIYVLSQNAAADFVTVANKAQLAKPSALLPVVTLSSEWEEKFSGKTVEVTISARAPEGTTAAELTAIYYTASAGNSGLRTFALGPEYSDVSFTYDVPARTGKAGVDYLGVAPASPDANASVDVRSIRIRIKPAP